MSLPSRAFLERSLALWKRRKQRRERDRDRTAARVRQARRNVRTRRAQLREHRSAKPSIITASQLGLRFQYLWGSKGTVYRGAWHYTAGPRAPDRAKLIELVRLYHRMHPGGLAYEAMIADDGTIALIGPMNRKGAAVAAQNTGMVNICAPGTTGDRLTAAQRESIRWLRENWHTRRVPKAHRAPGPVRGLDWRGHREHPGQSTSCPGAMLPDYKETWR